MLRLDAAGLDGAGPRGLVAIQAVDRRIPRRRRSPRAPSDGRRPAGGREPGRPVSRGASRLCHDGPCAPTVRATAAATRSAGRRPRARRHRAPGPRRCCSAARSGSGTGDAARVDRKPGDLVDPGRRDRGRRAGAVRQPRRPQARRGAGRVRHRSGAAGSASTSAPRPAASRTCCCSAARGASMLSTWGAASSPRRSGAIRAWSRWSGRTRGPSPRRRSRSRSRSRASTSRSSRSASCSGRSRRRSRPPAATSSRS